MPISRWVRRYLLKWCLVFAIGVSVAAPCFGQAPPNVIESPRSRTNEFLSSAEFHVIATGATKLSYQWRFAGQPMVGETNPIVILHRLQGSQGGDYTVVVSNAGGAVTSPVATLTIIPRSPLPKLAMLGVTEGQIAVALEGGAAGRHYLIESSTNLLQWVSEEYFKGAEFVVLQDNQRTEFSIPLAYHHQFLRAVPDLNKEACVAQLEGIQAAIRLFALETGALPDGIVSASDLEPYFTQLPPCPSGGLEAKFEHSYSVTDVSERPECMISNFHRLSD